MKPAVTFVLALLCSLFSGCGYAHPASQAAKLRSSLQIIQSSPGNTAEDGYVLHTDFVADDAAGISFLEDDDSDDLNEQCFTERAFKAFYHVFTSGNHTMVVCPLPATGEYCQVVSTRKFILQRVLRI